MWLLETSTLELCNFLDDSRRPYFVILSHTWGAEETSFQEIQGPHDIIESKAGYAKVKSFCSKAIRDGFQYVWVDTCCIDKTNSAELSEAINSMFRWYQEAVKCYAYLEDVRTTDANFDEEGTHFSKSRWFTRGWTLQELLAPETVVFVDRNWIEIGRKKSMKHIISEITGVPTSILDSSKVIQSASVAQRMSWAALRNTTRVEDNAYCLLGIFDVSMPLVYGEGTKAFTRLQMEIMKSSADQSLFAWKAPVPPHRWSAGPLAISPLDFYDCGTIVSGPENESSMEEMAPATYEMTNRGLRISLPLTRLSKSVCAILTVRKENRKDFFIGIYLKPTNAWTYVRFNPDLLFEASPESFRADYANAKSELRTIFIQDPPTGSKDYLSYQISRTYSPVTISIEHNAAWHDDFKLIVKSCPFPNGFFQEDIPLTWTVKYGTGISAYLFDCKDSGIYLVLLRLHFGTLSGSMMRSPDELVSETEMPKQWARKVMEFNARFMIESLWKAGDFSDPISLQLPDAYAEVHIKHGSLQLQNARNTFSVKFILKRHSN